MTKTRKPYTRRKVRASNWVVRRVAVMAYDSMHTMHMINAEMPVRIKDRTGDTIIYEGPTDALWAKLRRNAPDKLADLQPFGTLVASTDAIYEGRIVWVELSVRGLSDRPDREEPL